ncbi:MAG: amino acid racemase [Lachnospiraceae bacterium]|jgi:aspartate racemase|nr:amino acid racemase [Lachnospiraceae bacterium]
MKKRKKLGVIGGMGPMATAHFLGLLTKMTFARKDQDHIEVFVHSCPAIPDRTRFIVGQSFENPAFQLVKSAKMLIDIGAEVLVIPCFTAHYFLKNIRKEINETIPVIDAVEETVASLIAAGISTAGIFATDGMIECGLYQERLESAGITAAVPTRAIQRQVMSLIYKQIKKGKTVTATELDRIAEPLFANGTEAVLLGCSELSLIDRGESVLTYVDALEVLAQSTVKMCGTLRKEYQ